MPAIDIISMHGEMPRVLPHMLPDGYSALAQNCHFRFGVITPVNDDQKSEVIFDMNPETLFLYSQNKWFTWSGIVDVVRSPVAQKPLRTCVLYRRTVSKGDQRTDCDIG